MFENLHSTAVVHFYRATIMHADVWRKRLDITSNWSVVTTAGIVTFCFAEETRTHSALLFALFFVALFALMEARRYQMYDLWRHHVRLLNRFFMAPSLGDDTMLRNQRAERELKALAVTLGTNKPRITLLQALGYRIRRNYGYLFTAIMVLWVIKLTSYSGPWDTLADLVAKASIGHLSGWWSVAFVFIFSFVSFWIGAHGPSETMNDWHTEVSPWERWFHTNTEPEELGICSLCAEDRKQKPQNNTPNNTPSELTYPPSNA